MRAAPAEACTASRVIARKSRRVDIAVALFMPVQSSRIKVNSALTSYGAARVLTEETGKAKRLISPLRLQRALYFL